MFVFTFFPLYPCKAISVVLSIANLYLVLTKSYKIFSILSALASWTLFFLMELFVYFNK